MCGAKKLVCLCKFLRMIYLHRFVIDFHIFPLFVFEKPVLFGACMRETAFFEQPQRRLVLGKNFRAELVHLQVLSAVFAQSQNSGGGVAFPTEVLVYQYSNFGTVVENIDVAEVYAAHCLSVVLYHQPQLFGRLQVVVLAFYNILCKHVFAERRVGVAGGPQSFIVLPAVHAFYVGWLKGAQVYFPHRFFLQRYVFFLYVGNCFLTTCVEAFAGKVEKNGCICFVCIEKKT